MNLKIKYKKSRTKWQIFIFVFIFLWKIIEEWKIRKFWIQSLNLKLIFFPNIYRKTQNPNKVWNNLKKVLSHFLDFQINIFSIQTTNQFEWQQYYWTDILNILSKILEFYNILFHTKATNNEKISYITSLTINA